MKDLLEGNIKEMIEAGVYEHLEYEKSELAEPTDKDDYQNGNSGTTIQEIYI